MSPGFEKIIAAVSGGADSLALLYWLVEQGAHPIVAHFNHHLRPAAQADADFVRQTAQSLNLPFVLGQANVRAHAVSQRLSLEEAARELRYTFLFETARQREANAVVTGHTADDQAETVLMHFLRGSALPGLKGMSASALLTSFDPAIPLLRPLLGWSRNQTEAFCRQRGLAYRSDETNADPAYLRNRLRRELLPLLENYNPQIRQTLNKTAQILQEEDALLREMEDQAWKQTAQPGSGFVRFERVLLGGLPAALRRRLLRRAAFLLKPSLRDVDFDTLQRAAALQPGPLTGGLQLLVENDSLYLTAALENLPAPMPQLAPTDHPPRLQAGQTLTLGPGWEISAALEPFDWTGTWPEPEGDSPLQFVIRVDALQAGEALSLRKPRRGDRLEPLGMPGRSVKLSDLFINLKIPRRMRGNWPLLCAGEQIVWVAGLRMAHTFRLGPRSHQALRLALRRV